MESVKITRHSAQVGKFKIKKRRNERRGDKKETHLSLGTLHTVDATCKTSKKKEKNKQKTIFRRYRMS